MDLFTAIKERRSCRNFLPDPVDQGIVEQILDAAIWAPSPLNGQPWEFVVVTRQETKEEIYQEAERCRQWGQEESGWKWLGKYRVDFLKTAPVLIAVVGDPRKTGLDAYLPEGGTGYQHACAAAIQNMNLAAHGLGLGALWFTLFDKGPIGEILGIDPEKKVLAVVCIGKPGGPSMDAPRKSVSEKTRYL